MSTDLILVADIGGTNARFAIAQPDDGGLTIAHTQIFGTSDFASLSDAAAAFLDNHHAKPAYACIAVAGPVGDKVIKLTNAAWEIDPGQLKNDLGLQDIMIVNDFEALAYGVASLQSDDLLVIKPGTADVCAPSIVMGPGTGFGQAILAPGDSQAQVFATEGGHVGFAPRTDEQIEIVKFLTRQRERVSVECLLSGQGLVNIHSALCEISNAPLAELSPGEITQAAVEKTDRVAVRTVDLFLDILGDVAGNMVLGAGARGGVTLGGGILPRIKDLFVNSDFPARFTDKGPMKAYLEAVPVKLIIRDGAALLGAGAMMHHKISHPA